VLSDCLFRSERGLNTKILASGDSIPLWLAPALGWLAQ